MMKRLVALVTALACLFAVPALAQQSGTLVNGRTQFSNGNGSPLAGGTVSVYQAGTSTPVTTYANPQLTTANAWPIVLDSNGMASIWLPPGFYNETVQDALGNTLFNQETMTTGYATGGASTTASAVGAVPPFSIVGNDTSTTASSASRPVASAYFSLCGTSGCTLFSGSDISGVSRSSAGSYFVNFSTSMPDGNYTVICSAGLASGATTPVSCMDASCANNGCTHLANGVALFFMNAAGTAVDPSGFNVTVLHN